MKIRRVRRESGMALLAVLIVLMVVAGSSSTFIWFMDREQARAGHRMRLAAAGAAAEAGVHRALFFLESAAPGRTWRPVGYSEPLMMGPLEGRFTLTITDGPGGTLAITSIGEVGGARRRIRAKVQLASPSLMVALFGASFVRIERPPATTVIVPYGRGAADRPWAHVAAGQELWFVTPDVSINDPSKPLDAPVGPVDGPAASGRASRRQPPGSIRVLLPRGAALTIDQDRRRVGLLELRAMGIYVDGEIVSAEALPPIPDIDASYYQTLASVNDSNARVNRAAGEHLGDDGLARKRDSVYTAEEFDHLQTFLQGGFAPPQLRGVIYIKGGFSLLDGHRLLVADGAIVAEGTVQVREGATLEVTHTAATRTLPGLLVLRAGALLVTRNAQLRAHGLVFAGSVIDVGDGASMDVVGAVQGADAGLSFRNSAGRVTISYDPAVLGTPGLLTPSDAPVIAWVTDWEDLP